MRILLDTHTFLQFIAGSSRLSNSAREVIENPDNDRLLSIASLWEMAIKISLGKLILAQPFQSLVPEQLNSNAIDILPITFQHVAVIATLPFHHRDPFDRILVAQSVVEAIPLVSADGAFDAYRITRIW